MPKTVLPPPAPDYSVSATNASWYVQGRVAEAAGDPVAARRALEWTKRSAPNNPYAHVAWADFLREQGDVVEAYEAYQFALSLAGLPSAHHGLGLLYLADGDYVLAEPHLRAAVQGDEVSGYPALMVAVQAAHGDTQALLTLEEWIKAPNVEPEERLTRVEMAMSLGRPDTARDDAIWLLGKRMDPDLGDVLLTASDRSCSIGVAWKWLGQHLYLNEDPAWTNFIQRLSALSHDARLSSLEVFPVGSVGERDSPRMRPINVDAFDGVCASDPYVLLGRSINTCEALPVFERAVVVEPLNLEALALLSESYEHCGFEAAAEEVAMIRESISAYQRERE